jgi:hypothetical protein
MKASALTRSLKRLLGVIRKYRYPIVGAVIIGLFAFTVWRIDYLSSPERDEEAYNEQLTTVERIEFDEAAIEAILELEDTGIDIQPNFPGNRNNPF